MISVRRAVLKQGPFARKKRIVREPTGRYNRCWWGPKSLGVSFVSCEADVRAGGTYRYVQRVQTGDEFAFSGKYTEITPHSRLVYTQVFEPMADGGEMIITVTFDEHDGKTHVVSPLAH